jgi:hypothetical protein
MAIMVVVVWSWTHGVMVVDLWLLGSTKILFVGSFILLLWITCRSVNCMVNGYHGCGGLVMAHGCGLVVWWTCGCLARQKHYIDLWMTIDA